MVFESYERFGLADIEQKDEGSIEQSTYSGKTGALAPTPIHGAFTVAST
jgi:hypothetical protein